MSATPPPPPPVIGPETRQLAMLCHLSGFFGFIGPLIFWLVKREECPYMDYHGKEALNFQITVIIGMFASMLLVFVCIGVLTAMAVGIANLVFSIIAGLAANEGKMYRYPVSIRFIK